MKVDIYGEEVTPTNGEHTRRHDRTTMAMFLDFFGRNRDPATLSQRDWDHFIRERRAGRIGPSGRPVSDRTVEYDLKFLIAVLNWAARSRDERGRPLLDRNPLKGFRKPTEKNPTRVVLTEDEYRALLKVAGRLDWRFGVALVLARTRRATGSEPYASFGGATSTSRAGRSSGAPSTTSRATNTPRPSRATRSPLSTRPGEGTPESEKHRCCPRPGIRWRVRAPLGCTLGGARPRFLRGWIRCPDGAGTR